MYSTLIYPLTTRERTTFWETLPPTWTIKLENTGGIKLWEVHRVGKFLQLVLEMLQATCYSKFRKRHPPAKHQPYPEYKDSDMFHNFWNAISSHGRLDCATYRNKAVSMYGQSKWFMVFLPIPDMNIIHRVVHSLEKQWPGCSAGISVAIVMSTFNVEKGILFAFVLPKIVYAQQVATSMGLGVIACTLLPKRVSVSLEWFFNSNYVEGVKRQVPLSDACNGDQQQVFAMVAKMNSYMEFPDLSQASASVVAQCCDLPHLLTDAS